MATSGSSNYSETRNAVILDALQLLGVYGVGRTVSSEDMTFCSSMLNKMVKTWGTQGLHLWCKTEGILHLTQYEGEYYIGNGVSDAKAPLESDEILTQLDGDLAASATSVTVLSTSGMLIGDNIGIVLDDKSLFWTTIATIPSSTTLTLSSGVSGAASDNSIVYTFTNKMYKPLRILSCRLLSGVDSGATSNLVELQMSPMSYQDYFNMPNKSVNGIPTQFCYDPKLTNGALYLWPRPSDTSYRVQFTSERLIEDMDTLTDDFDFPSEWLETLTWQLAMRVAPAFGKDKKMLATIGPMASALLETLKEWDAETIGFDMVPGGSY
jgi:hypothetical protein